MNILAETTSYLITYLIKLGLLVVVLEVDALVCVAISAVVTHKYLTSTCPAGI